ncbi:MAG TPA: hypothetical protein PK537_10970 [Candidatus Limiplasma sp.]|nr:hypothetical protein [Candidatus Limiplasma sp.]
MGCHLIALGGTGQKTLEMLTYACACDALYTLDDDLRRWPADSLSVLTVDTDANAEPAAQYQALQTVLAAAGLPHAGFHTQLLHEHLSIAHDGRADVQSIAKGRDQLLTRTLFTLRKSSLDAREGLRGHADIGMFFFADALYRLSERMAQGEACPFFDRIQSELDRGEDVKVFLAGSVYGGTGMSGIPSMARFLRGRYPSDRLTVGAALLLPPYDPRNADRYNARAVAALNQYGTDGLARRNAFDTTGLLDAVYPIRMRENLYAATYAQAAGSAEGDFRLKDWLAARCASQFFATDFRGDDAENIGVYHTPRNSDVAAWPCFDDDRAYFRLRFGGLMRAAALHLAECDAQITAGLAGKARMPHYAQPFFKFSKKFTADQRDALAILMDALRAFCGQYVRRMDEVQRFLPPPMPGKAEAESFFDIRALQALQRLSALPAEDAAGRDALRRVVRDALPVFVTGGISAAFSVKRVLAQLGKGRRPETASPTAAFAAYTAALFNSTAQGTSSLPALQLPPPSSQGINPNHSLLTLARNIPLSNAAPLCDAPDILAREARLARLLALPYQQSVQQQEVIEWRALLAVLLLWDGWEARHHLPVLHCGQPPEGEGTRAVLAAMQKTRLDQGLVLFTLEKDVDGMPFEGPLGLLSYQTGLLSAADPQKLCGILPECVRWYNPDDKSFADPCPLLSETDRARLIHRLKCLQALVERAELKSPLHKSGGALYAAADAFLGDLQSRHDFWREHFERDDQRAIEALYIRTLAVYGPSIEGLERREEELSLHDIQQNPLMNRLLGDPASAPRGLTPSVLFSSEPLTSYLYQGRPFAIDSQRYLLTPVNAEGEQDTLARLSAVIQTMTSPAYHRQAAKRFLELANRLTSRSGASRKAVSLLRAWSIRHSRLADTSLLEKREVSKRKPD